MPQVQPKVLRLLWQFMHFRFVCFRNFNVGRIKTQKSIFCEWKKSHRDSVWGAQTKREKRSQWQRCRRTESTESKPLSVFHPTWLQGYIHASSIQSEIRVSFDCTFGGAESFIIQFRGSSNLTKLICIQSKWFHVEATLRNSKSVFTNLSNFSLFPCSCQPTVLSRLSCFRHVSPPYAKQRSTCLRKEQQLLS